MARRWDLCQVADRRLAFGGETGDLDPGLLQPFDGAGEIDHADHRYGLQSPGGGAGQCAALIRRIAVGADDGARAKRQRAAHDRADIARVRQLIEKEKPDRRPADHGKQFFQIGRIQRPYGGHNALMDGFVSVAARPQRIEPAPVAGGDGRHVGAAVCRQSCNRLFKFAGGILGRVERGDPPLGFLMGRQNGMPSPQEMTA